MKALASPNTGVGATHFPTFDHRLMKSLSGTAQASSQPYFSITEQRRYAAFVLNYAAATLALTAMTITLLLDGTPFQIFTADKLNAWNQYDNLPAAAANTGQLIIPFYRPRMKTLHGSLLSAINLGVPYQASGSLPNGFQEMQVQIGFDSTPVAITTFELYGLTSDVNPEQSVWLPRKDTWQETLGASSTMQYFQQRITKQGDATRREVYRLWAQDTAAHVTRTRIYENGDPSHDCPTSVEETSFVAMNETRNIQSGWRALYDGGMYGDPYETIKSYALNTIAVALDTGAGVASPMTIVAESYGTYN